MSAMIVRYSERMNGWYVTYADDTEALGGISDTKAEAEAELADLAGDSAGHIDAGPVIGFMRLGPTGFTFIPNNTNGDAR
jgi:hypothetical protein